MWMGVQDGIHLPYENVLDYDKFAVRIKEADLPNMVTILRVFAQGRPDVIVFVCHIMR